MVETRGPQAAGAAGLFLGLSWIFVLLRCYCRAAIVRRFGPEDYLCVISQVALSILDLGNNEADAGQVIFTVYCTLVLVGVQYGTGRHAVDIIPPTDIPIGLKWWWICEQLYCLTCLTLKFSIGLFLLQITVHKSQTIILWTVMIVSGLMSIYFALLFLFQCRPVTYFWGQHAGMNGSCIDPAIISRTAYVYSVVSCWSDWTFCILPAFMVWNVQMNPRTKASVLLVFALGAVASTMTIVRFPYLNTLQDKADFLYATTNVGILTTSEMGVGIVTSAAATLRPLFRRFLERSQPGSSSVELSRPWQSGRMRAGYVRNRDGDPSLTDEEYIGVTTVARIESHSIEGKEDTLSKPGINNAADTSSTNDSGKWHTGKFLDACSEEYRPHIGTESRPKV
ncbi:Uncharacterized protein BP5553_06272 [Venustampulla echinocandica]|uniref:Rhodopsin domain-containing protein n=1 Tax=Venustampulla echinocandica TaxID=2656787 RepID=A0A370TN06_9HELO|nr:Uncharacterized protein BP5553_06272 [Venustampulla echinocandica]RDL36920.1 Uncharacterized protein BP5553_06272 [Venustampulla echinocandica]